MHAIEINKSFRLLALFGNGYTASTSYLFIICNINSILQTTLADNFMTLGFKTICLPFNYNNFNHYNLTNELGIKQNNQPLT